MINKCLFPVAGYGTRFLPATKAMPKEMLPILNKPLIQYGVEEALGAGMTEMAFVTGRGKRAIEDHFDVSYETEHQIAGTGKEALLSSIRKLIDECTFSYTRQTTIRGLGDAIQSGRTLIGNVPFGVLLADDLCFGEGHGVLAQMVNVFKQFRCSVVAIAAVPPEDTDRYGIISGEPVTDRIFRVSDMVEKPPPDEAPSNLAIVGRYILTPDIFEILDETEAGRNKEVQITDALLNQAKQRAVIAYKFQGKRFDCGTIPGFVDATNFCYARNHLQ